MTAPYEASTMTVRQGSLVPAAPRFSVIIPCYNVGSMAREAVESALAQTVPDVEVIVVDDGSQVQVIEHLRPMLERIVLVRKTNGGISSARNTGIRHARGEYIVLLDGDDALLPSHCTACQTLFDTHPDCLAAAPDAWIFGEGQPSGLRLSDLYPRQSPINLERFLSGKALVPGYCTFRKVAFDGIAEPYDVELSSAEDFLLHAQFLSRGVKYRFLDEPTYRYRKRAGSLSFSNPIPLNRAVLQAIDKLLSECDHGSPEERLLLETQKRYRTELNFHLFREAVLSRAYQDALRHTRDIQVEYLHPAQRRWKFRASWIIVTLLSRILPR